MTTATIIISGQTILISGTWYPHSGDGFNDPIEPAGWEINEIILNGIDYDYEDIMKMFNISENDLFNMFEDALSEQDKSDYEYNFI